MRSLKVEKLIALRYHSEGDFIQRKLLLSPLSFDFAASAF